jgi:CubicO group peptidase (beta-lactamase class C family)
MTAHGLPGLAVTVARRGTVVYQEATGFADPARRERLTPDHLFRIASISKPVTAVAVFALAEEGRLKPEDRVFGQGGLLEKDFGKAPSTPVGKITVRHLLTHTCGGWGNSRNDPMFRNPALNHHDLIARTLRDHPLEHEPGTHHAYSNFGYCVLGRVIEKLTGRPYAEHVREAVLAKCGVTSMRIAGNTRDDRAPGEVAYVDTDSEAPYRMNVARMDAHGGWLGSTGDLVKFACRVDGFENPPDILRPGTLRTITATDAVSPNYGCGWAVNRVPNWWHGGSIPGTTTLLVRTASGLCWAAFANSRTKDSSAALDRFMWDLVRSVPAWRA